MTISDVVQGADVRIMVTFVTGLIGVGHQR